MKKSFWSLLFVLTIALEMHAPYPAYAAGATILPKPSPQTAGKLVYESMGCNICHGAQGKGDGPLAGNLDPKPRNFTDLNVMSRVSDMSMFHAIKNGIPDTAMPAWELTEEQVFDTISYIKTFLADSQTTINICFNEQRTIDLRHIKLVDSDQINIDRKQFLKFKLKGSNILIQPNFENALRYFRETGKKLVRTHVVVTRSGQAKYRALVAVRISDCLK